MYWRAQVESPYWPPSVREFDGIFVNTRSWLPVRSNKRQGYFLGPSWLHAHFRIPRLVDVGPSDRHFLIRVFVILPKAIVFRNGLDGCSRHVIFESVP